MIGRKKETAEQKLLKMIEASHSDGGAAKKSKKKTVIKKDPVGVVKGLNRLLILGVLVVLGLLGYEIKLGLELAGQPVEFEAPPTNLGSRSASILPTTQELQFYLTGVDRRNLFVPYEEQVEVADTRKPESGINSKTKNLRLVGISWLDRVDTASAMIEDKDKGITHFLQRGDRVGDVTVDTIYADSVELNYQSEEKVLTYDKPQL